MKPWPSVPSAVRDVAVTNVTTSKTGCLPVPTVGQGYNATVRVTVENHGDVPETFNVTIYANTTSITNMTVTSLLNGTSTILTFNWNTTGYAYGNYTVSAYAWPVPYETNTTNNNMTDGTVFITVPGDANGDGKCDMKDIVQLILHFNAKEGQPDYLSNCDINNDKSIDMKDIVIAILHFSQKW